MTQRMKFRTYKTLRRLGLITQESEDRLQEAPRPDRLCGKAIPQDLNDLTMGQLADIMSLKQGDEIEAVRVVAGIDPKDLDREQAVKVIGLINFIQSELHRIADLFKQLKPNYTKEERQAGVEDLDFGIFGTIDWYAQRMGITDHDEVLKVPWLHIWQCSKIDKEHHEYQQRYQETLYQNSKP